MTYKDKEKAREASKERQRRYKAKQKALLNEGVTEALPQGVTVILKAEQHVGASQIGDVQALYKETGSKAKPRASDPDVQAIWDKRNAQGQAAYYDEQAKPEDYPQTQRPMRWIETPFWDRPPPIGMGLGGRKEYLLDVDIFYFKAYLGL